MVSVSTSENSAKDAPQAHPSMVRMGLSYAMPLVPVLLLQNNLIVLQGTYAKHYGLSLTTLSIVMMVVGLFDAITDPTVGYWSDRYHAKKGTRKPFIVAGMIMALPCAWFLFVPVTDEMGHVSLIYFIFWYMAFYFAVTLVHIPHMSMGPDLSNRSSERTKIYGFRTLGSYIGLTLYKFIPLLPLFATTAITPETIRFTVILSICVMFPFIYMFIKYVPSGVVHREVGSTPDNPFIVLKELFTNAVFLIMLSATLCFSLSIGVFYGLMFIVVDVWLGFGDQYVFLLLFHMAFAFLMLRPAVWLTNHFGKRKTMVLSILVAILCSVPVSLLLLQRGEHSLLLAYLVQMLLGISSALGNVSIPSLMTDLIDYDRLMSGKDRSATYFSVQNFIAKIGTTTLGFPLGVGLVGYYGFDPAKPEWTNDVLFGFELAMGWIPAAIGVVTLVLFLIVPLTPHRRKIIRKRLAARDERLSKEQIQETVNE